MSSRALRAAAVLGLLAAMTACSSVMPPPAPPKLRAGALDQIGPRLTNYGTAVVPPGAIITLWGDAFAAGAPATSTHPPKGKPITLAGVLAKATGLQVMDHTSPGQTAAEGLAALTQGDAGRLVVLCYGYGDDARGTKDFKASIDGMIRLAHSRGVAVLLVTKPLPVVTPTLKPTAAELRKLAFSLRISALQDIVRAEAPIEGAGLVDSTVVLNPPAPTPQAVNRNALTPAEKEPGSVLSTERIAHAIAAEIELAQ